MKVEEKKVVTLDYIITTEKGELIESSAGRGDPLVFLFGKSGMLPGLDEALRGMEKGEEKEFDLPPEAIVTVGAGNYTGWVHRFYRHRGYGTQLAPISGSMGYGMPAAIAAKIAKNSSEDAGAQVAGLTNRDPAR